LIADKAYEAGGPSHCFCVDAFLCSM
jgi:hypothetical protein